MARIESRLTRLERGELERLASVYCQLGGSPDDALIWARAHRRAMAEAPPIPLPDGMEDVSPTLRLTAELMGLAPEEVFAEARRIVATYTD